jgi:hypothetical protein
MSFGLLASQVIEANTHGNVIDHRGVAQDFGCDFSEQTFMDSTKKGTLSHNSAPGRLGTFQFNRFNSEEENNSLTALLLAQQLLNISQNIFRHTHCDVFFLRELRKHRMSQQLMLATRLAIPDTMIAKISDIRFNSMGYSKDANLMSEFVNSAFHIEDGKGFFNMLDRVSFSASVSLARHTLPDTLHQYLWETTTDKPVADTA